MPNLNELLGWIAGGFAAGGGGLVLWKKVSAAQTDVAVEKDRRSWFGHKSRELDEERERADKAVALLERAQARHVEDWALVERLQAQNERLRQERRIYRERIRSMGNTVKRLSTDEQKLAQPSDFAAFPESVIYEDKQGHPRKD